MGFVDILQVTPSDGVSLISAYLIWAAQYSHTVVNYSSKNRVIFKLFHSVIRAIERLLQERSFM